jgi:hypothetical protein
MCLTLEGCPEKRKITVALFNENYKNTSTQKFQSIKKKKNTFKYNLPFGYLKTVFGFSCAIRRISRCCCTHFLFFFFFSPIDSDSNQRFSYELHSSCVFFIYSYEYICEYILYFRKLFHLCNLCVKYTWVFD